MDRKPEPGAVWNRLRPEEQQRIVQEALRQPDLSPRELALHLNDHAGFAVSEATVYRVLRRHGLHRTVELEGFPAGKEYRVKTTAPISSGSPTPVISSWWAGAGTTSSRCWTITRA